MKTITGSFRKGKNKGFDKMHIDTIVYEKNDDGLVLECEIEHNSKTSRRSISIDFYEWNNILGKIADPFLSSRLQEIISEMAFNSVEWITEIRLPNILGKQVEVANYDFENQYFELRA